MIESCPEGRLVNSYLSYMKITALLRDIHFFLTIRPPFLFLVLGGLYASVYSHPKTFGIIMDTYCQDSPWNIITCLQKFDLPGSSFRLRRAAWSPSALLWRGLFLIKENILYLLIIMELRLFGLRVWIWLCWCMLLSLRIISGFGEMGVDDLQHNKLTLNTFFVAHYSCIVYYMAKGKKI